MATTIDKYVLETSVTGLDQIKATNKEIESLGTNISAVSRQNLSFKMSSTGFAALEKSLANISTAINNISNKTIAPKISMASIDALNGTLGTLITRLEQGIKINVNDSEVIAAKNAVSDLDKKIDGVNKKPVNIKSEGTGLFATNLKNVGEAFTTFKGNILGAAIGAAVGAAAIMAKNAVELSGKLTDLSNASGVSTSRLNDLRSTIIQSGGAAEDYNKVVDRLIERINEASGGNEKAIQTFKDLNVPIKDINGNMRDTTDILKDSIRELGNIDDKNLQAKMSTDLLDKSLRQIDWAGVAANYDPKMEAAIKKTDEFGAKWDKVSSDLSNVGIKTLPMVADVAKGLATPFLDLGIIVGDVIRNMNIDFDVFKKTLATFANWMPNIKFPSMFSEAADKTDPKVKMLMAVGGGIAQGVGLRNGLLGRKGYPAMVGGASVKPIMNEADRIRAEQKDREAARLREQSRLKRQESPTYAYDTKQFGTPKPKAGGGGADDAKREADERKRSEEAAWSQWRAMVQISQLSVDALRFEGSLIGMSDAAATKATEQNRLNVDAKRDLLAIEESIIKEKEKGIKANPGVLEALSSQKTVVNNTLNDLKAQTELNSKKKKSIEDQTKALSDQYDAGLKVFELSTSEEQKTKTVIEKEMDNQQSLVDRYKEQYEALKLIGEENGLLSATYLTAKTAFDDYHANYLAKLSEQQALIAQLTKAEKDRTESFSGGWSSAMKSMVESMKPAQLGAQAFNDLWGTISSSIDTAVTTGKFKFADFRDSIINDLAKMAAKALASKFTSWLIGSFVSPVGKSTDLLGGDKGGSALPRASGGAVGANQPYIVGERGPELFMPGQSGTVIPNSNLGGDTKPQVVNNYTYNVSAVDGQSVARFFMENKNLVAAANNSVKRERS